NLTLDFVVSGVVFADAGNGSDLSLIVETTNAYWPVFAGIVDQELSAFLHFVFGGPSPTSSLYRASLIKVFGRAHCRPSLSNQGASQLECRTMPRGRLGQSQGLSFPGVPQWSQSFGEPLPLVGLPWAASSSSTAS